MNDSVKRAIVDTLGQVNEEDRYYVYALCEKVNEKCIPFYIGKGQGERIWQHEIEADDLLETLKTEALEEVQQERTNKFREKHKEIERLIKEGRYERKIIKWGLKQEEAFMVESALINFIGFKNLTNLVNGHASQKEKNSNIHTTKAMTTDEFYGSCCRKPIYLNDVQEKWLFINLNSFYPKISDPTDVMQVCDATRGYWGTACDPDYIFGVYQSRIVGIFKCTDCIKVSDVNPDDKRLPKYPEIERDDDKNAIDKKEPSIMKRYFFTCDTLKESDTIELSGELDEKTKKSLDGVKSITVGDLLGRPILLDKTTNKSIFVRYPIRFPDLRIYNKSNVRGLTNALLKYFLKVEMQTKDKEGCLREIDSISDSKKKADKRKEIEQFFNSEYYELKETGKADEIAKQIFVEMIQKSRKALSKCIKDNR
jgi:hypothetical protein